MGSRWLRSELDAGKSVEIYGQTRDAWRSKTRQPLFLEFDRFDIGKAPSPPIAPGATSIVSSR
jgi:hypothetical protein